jgi:hypothetical protein
MSSAAAVEASKPAAEVADAGSPLRSLSLGWLAMAPLFITYELALLNEGAVRRNTGELALGLALRPLGEQATNARWIALAACAAVAWIVCKRRKVAIAAGVARIFLEGLACAIVLGPLLVIALHAMGRELDLAWHPSASPPRMLDAALLFGGSAWEEMLFRVGLYSLVWLLTLRFCSALGLAVGLGRAFAEVTGLSLSAGLFALAHFTPVTHWFGSGGRELDPTLFAWYALAGVLLGLIFRWRGPGVAAWAHGLFNLALVLGVDPDVIL